MYWRDSRIRVRSENVRIESERPDGNGGWLRDGPIQLRFQGGEWAGFNSCHRFRKRLARAITRRSSALQPLISPLKAGSVRFAGTSLRMERIGGVCLIDRPRAAASLLPQCLCGFTFGWLVAATLEELIMNSTTRVLICWKSRTSAR